MRVLIDYRPALRQRTGVGEYVHELAAAVARTAPASGETLTLFSSSWKDRLPGDVIPGAETIDVRVPVSVLNFAWHRLRWPPIERVTGRRFDVVQSPHPLPIPASAAAQVVTVHDFDFLDHPERTQREIRRDYAALAPRALQTADHIVANSRHTALEVQRRFGVGADRITVCSPGAPAWPRRLSEPANGYVLFFGTLEPRKNVGVLLDAFARLAERGEATHPLVLAGGTPPESAALIERTQKLPLAGRVEVRGYIDPARRLELYQGALAIVMPSHTEGFGIPALEAMTVGVPVIAAERGALPEVVGPAGLLVNPEDAESLAAALRRVMTEESLRHGMRDAGWRQAEQFQWTDSAARVREAWRKAVERRRSRRG